MHAQDTARWIELYQAGWSLRRIAAAYGLSYPTIRRYLKLAGVKIRPPLSALSLEDRFWLNVDKTETCWLWTASLFKATGYGQFNISYGKPTTAHSYSWKLLNGPVPDGLELDHLCRVRRCVRPDHLEAVTHRVNVLRGRSAASQNARKTHCLRGHPLTADNTMRRSRGGRECLTCHRERELRRIQRLRN